MLGSPITICALQDAWGMTPLHWAAMRGHERTVALLIVRDASVDVLSLPTQKRSGRTAADLASQNGHPGMAAYLAELTVMEHLEKQDKKIMSDGLSGKCK
jgi:calmodulin-binding transcription activator